MSIEEQEWLDDGGALTRAERAEAGQLAVCQEQGLCHLPGDVLARIHAYDVAVDAGVPTQAPGVAA
jgi:hypothetical protein